MLQTDQVQSIQAKLTESLKKIYSLALKADERLEVLNKANVGKFSSIFQDCSGFSSRSNRFLPYLVELSDEVKVLSLVEAENQGAKIKDILGKIKLMHQVLIKFHAIKELEN